MEALVAATKSGAEVLRVDHITGTLTVGKYADIIIMKKNPLDDIDNMNYDNIYMVMKKGEIVRK